MCYFFDESSPSHFSKLYNSLWHALQLYSYEVVRCAGYSAADSSEFCLVYTVCVKVQSVEGFTVDFDLSIASQVDIFNDPEWCACANQWGQQIAALKRSWLKMTCSMAWSCDFLFTSDPNLPKFQEHLKMKKSRKLAMPPIFETLDRFWDLR